MEMVKYVLQVVGILVACIFTFTMTAEAPTQSPQPSIASLMTERRLYESLLKPYNKDIRPAAIDQPLVVEFGFKLVRIHKLDIKSESLEVHTWLRMAWKDAFLTWSPEHFGNITLLRVPIKNLWFPDIKLYNSIEPESETMETMAMVGFDGKVMWVPRVNLKAHCSIARNKDGQPEDVQSCYFKFGSWVYSGSEVDLVLVPGLESIDLVDYFTHTRYEITNSTAVRNEVHYACCPESYPDVTFNLTLRRVKNDYKGGKVDDAYALQFPSRADGIILTIVMVLLVPTVFLLPPASKEKITLGVGILVSMSVLLANDATHKLAMLWEMNMVLVAASIVSSAILLNVWHNSDRASKLPSFLHKIIFFLAKYCCVGVRCSGSVSEDGVELSENEIHQDSVDGKYQLYTSDWRMFVKVMDRLLWLAFIVITIICFVFALQL